MFLPMMTTTLKDYFEATPIPMRLACVTAAGWPMIVSLWFLYREGYFYCATQRTAKVIKYLQQEPRCAFEISADQMPYCGIRGQGTAIIDPVLGVEILTALLQRYLGGTDNALAQKLLAHRGSEVAIVIKPVKLYQWNYTDRMKDVVPAQNDKPCP